MSTNCSEGLVVTRMTSRGCIVVVSQYTGAESRGVGDTDAISEQPEASSRVVLQIGRAVVVRVVGVRGISSLDVRGESGRGDGVPSEQLERGNVARESISSVVSTRLVVDLHVGLKDRQII